MSNSINTILEDKKFIKLPSPIVIDKSFEIIGYYPYETKRIQTKSPRISRDVLNTQIINWCPDNKIVVICKDLVRFGTNNFAMFIHDFSVTFGNFNEIKEY